MFNETGPGSAGLPSRCQPRRQRDGAGTGAGRQAGLDAGQAAHSIQTQLELI